MNFVARLAIATMVSSFEKIRILSDFSRSLNKREVEENLIFSPQLYKNRESEFLQNVPRSEVDFTKSDAIVNAFKNIN